MKKWQAFAWFLMLFIVLALAAFFVHELGHGFTAKLLGGGFHSLYVWPGVEIWPDFAQPYPGEWSGNIGMARLDFPDDWSAWQPGLVYLMGSGSNMLAGALALVLLWVLHPAGLLRILLVAETIMFIDLPFYTFLPLIGLRHYVIVGGETPEPLDGAIRMGIPAWAFLIIVGVSSILMVWGLASYLRRYPLWGGEARLTVE